MELTLEERIPQRVDLGLGIQILGVPLQISNHCHPLDIVRQNVKLSVTFLDDVIRYLNSTAELELDSALPSGQSVSLLRNLEHVVLKFFCSLADDDLWHHSEAVITYCALLRSFSSIGAEPWIPPSPQPER